MKRLPASPIKSRTTGLRGVDNRKRFRLIYASMPAEPLASFVDLKLNSGGFFCARDASRQGSDPHKTFHREAHAAGVNTRLGPESVDAPLDSSLPVTMTFRRAFPVSLAGLLLLLESTSVIAQPQGGVYGLLTYKELEAHVEIIDCDSSAAGHLEIPAVINGKPVTVIGELAFSGLEDLTSVTVSENVTVIGERAFLDCANLASIVLPEGLLSIERWAFANCRSLDNLILPATVTYIGHGAFTRCSSLTSIVIPQGVTKIEDAAFSYCSNLASVTLPEGLVSIGQAAFQGCSSLEAIRMPSSVETIDSSAFSGCTNLSTVSLREGLITIGSLAFAGCQQLEAIAIPASTEVIEPGAFARNRGLFNIDVHPENAVYSSLDGVLLRREEEIAAFPEGKGGHYEIPPTITTIGRLAFYDSQLTNVTIPENVTTIESEAFQRSENLVSIDIPDSVTFIGDWAFAGCTSLTTARYSGGVASTSEGVFWGCTSLTELMIPSGVTAIRDSSFRNCYRLTHVSLPPGLTSIGAFAFYDCRELAHIEIPDSVTSIGGSAFAGCSKLVSVTLPENLTSIGSWAFVDCAALTRIMIPASVSSIGERAFARCRELTEAIFLGDAPAMGDWVFTGVASGFAIYHFNDRVGFSAPAWSDYSLVKMGAFSPLVHWLVEKGFEYDADPATDVNGDGVPLLMAYALNLDPRAVLKGELPAVDLEADSLQLSFFGDAEGINYIVETSTTLADWTTDDVILSPPGDEGRRTASVPLGGTVRFLRLRVER